MGYKYNMMDLCAAMGRVQLRRTEEFQNKRRAIVEQYRQELSGIDGLRLPYASPGEALHLFTVEIDPGRGMDRDRFVEEMYARKIGTSLHFIPLYRHTFYKKKYGLRISDFPNSEEIYRRIVSLPLSTTMTREDVSDVTRAVREILD